MRANTIYAIIFVTKVPVWNQRNPWTDSGTLHWRQGKSGLPRL